MRGLIFPTGKPSPLFYKFSVAFLENNLYKFSQRQGACGGTGRRCRLKICWPQGRAGSIPA